MRGAVERCVTVRPGCVRAMDMFAGRLDRFCLCWRGACVVVVADVVLYEEVGTDETMQQKLSVGMTILSGATNSRHRRQS